MRIRRKSSAASLVSCAKKASIVASLELQVWIAKNTSGCSLSMHVNIPVATGVPLLDMFENIEIPCLTPISTASTGPSILWPAFRKAVIKMNEYSCDYKPMAIESGS